MSSAIYEINGYGHDLDLLIISHVFHGLGELDAGVEVSF